MIRTLAVAVVIAAGAVSRRDSTVRHDVVRGMDVVRAIHASPTGQAGAHGTESLAPPITIVKASRRRPGA